MAEEYIKQGQGYHDIKTLTLDIMEELSIKNNRKDTTKYLEDKHGEKNARNISKNHMGG